ncbi:hypothetical protein CCL42_gp61 [Sulfolobus islandicus rod-shaped virus 8]|uniref:Uncharacterized protein n=2 Tax=Usarudivirus TaxID=2843109 RepID=A0A1X9SJJ1_9VIRU|nr:hypothetical protein CCL41_gp57 [Sulfolobus islandicus rod-shaped virus 9]YP_009362734.1 hypothetical protein CCL42_gp61 [Sulfolobus islandicus rod-shaped virus 8]ARQ96405.1 hypothetical protein [Sulfolobus islandicus rod-shaped virus 9]ARQ96467.1 hypothetical protein [Sulfolobus islandicus rod-shaped virus 8]
MLYSLMIKITKNRDLKKERKIYKGGHAKLYVSENDTKIYNRKMGSIYMFTLQ